MYLYKYIHIYTYMHIYIYINIHIYIHIYAYRYIYIQKQFSLIQFSQGFFTKETNKRDANTAFVNTVFAVRFYERD